MPLALPGNSGEEQLLHIIAVLVFIDQDLLKVASIAQRCLTRLHAAVLFAAAEDLQGIVLQIIKVDEVLFLLGFVETVQKIQRQLHQCHKGFPGCFHFEDRLGGKLSEDLFSQRLCGLFAAAAHLLDRAL